MTKKEIGDVVWGKNEKWGSTFDLVMMVLILLSIFALAIETLPDLSSTAKSALNWFEVFIILVFTIEYGLRIWTSEKPLKYALSFWGIVDILAIIPFWLAAGSDAQAARLLRLLRLIRILKLFHYMSALGRLKRAVQIVQDELAIFGLLALIMIVLAAIGIYHFEHEAQPEAFASIPHSLWFSVVTLTTVGYGDVTPITMMGRLFTALTILIGLGIVAVPTGLIASGLTRARDEERELKEAALTEKLSMQEAEDTIKELESDASKDE